MANELTKELIKKLHETMQSYDPYGNNEMDCPIEATEQALKDDYYTVIDNLLDIINDFMEG